jgi:uncharacterized membrane protein YfhO
MELTSMTDRTVEGEITVTDPGRLVLSIPADEGWTLYVDGKETEIEPLSDALIGVTLGEGTHTISLSYTTPGVKAGAAGTFAALALFAVSMLFEIMRSKKEKGNE